MTIVTQLRNCVENSFKDNQFSTYGLNRLPWQVRESDGFLVRGKRTQRNSLSDSFRPGYQ